MNPICTQMYSKHSSSQKRTVCHNICRWMQRWNTCSRSGYNKGREKIYEY